MRGTVKCVLFIYMAVCPWVCRGDLVGYWTFNDNSSTDAQFADVSGNGYSTHEGLGTVPAITENGKVSYGLQGKGGGKYNYNLTSAGVSSGNMTISFWGNWNGMAAWKDFLSLYTSDDLHLQATDGSSVGSYFGTNTSTVIAVASTNITSGFHNIVLTCDASASAAKLYIDGEVRATGSWTKTDAVGYLCLCGAYNSGGRNSTAIVDEVQLYNGALSAEQVSYIYNNPALYAASTYERTVSAAGNWTDAAWKVGTKTNQAWANSSAVKLTATDAPTLTVDSAITVNSIDFVSGSMTVDGTSAITLNGEKRIGVTNAADTATISAPIATGFTKTGAGTLALTNTSNTLAGGVEIQAGKLTANSVGALGISASRLTAALSTFPVPERIKPSPTRLRSATAEEN